MSLELQTAQPSSSTKKVKGKPSTDSLRVKKETKKKILAELASLNRKDYGRPITPDEYVALAISLLKPEHMDQLKQRSLSNKDRLEMRYQKHCAAHGKISKDEFIGILLASEQGEN